VRYRFVDCAWELLDPDAGRRLYERVHVPGASHLDLDRDLSDLSVPDAGRHPLPSAAAFAEAAGRAGVGPGVFVVAYDQGTGGAAARLWWLLRHFGHEECAVLRGGLAAWGGALASGEERVEPAAFEPRPRGGDTIDADELHARLREPGLVVLDARAPGRYSGADLSGLDPHEGHIPGAVNLPYTSAAPLPREVLDAKEIVASCGSGVTACVLAHELTLAGRPDVRLYPGSWSDWSRRGLPYETGPG
jgi:thiosulfate/3-mercaptopyruvate sulfurtransferase